MTTNKSTADMNAAADRVLADYQARQESKNMAFKIKTKEFDELSTLRKTAEDAVVEYKEKLQSLFDDFDGEYGERSEKWQEGDKGQEVRGWLDEIEQVLSDLDNVDIGEVSQEPG